MTRSTPWYSGRGSRFSASSCTSVMQSVSPAGVTAPATAADLIDWLRATGTVLTYDPDTRTVGTIGTIGTRDDTAVAVTVGQCS